MRYVAVPVFVFVIGCQDLLGFRPFVVGTGSDAIDASSGGGSRASEDATVGDGTTNGGAKMVVMNAPGGALPAGAGGTGGAPGMGGGGTAGASTAGAGGCVPRCDGKEDSVTAIECDRRGTLDCMKTAATHQCDPAGGTCIDVDIDATEVTFRDYYAWLSKAPPVEVPGCSWKGTFAPDDDCLNGARLPCAVSGAPTCDADASCAASAPDCSTSSFPIVCVDWCDAAAYCISQGRRLCGRLSGGATPFDSFKEPGQSTWMNACSAGGQFIYGSGDIPPLDCSYADMGMYEAGSRDGCGSPSPGYSRFKDLSGNAAEWEDSCRWVSDAAPGQYDECHIRGGSHVGVLERVRCDANETLRRSEVRSDLGFRCCGS
jgi:sulfatase modifying factor 1